MAKQDSKKKAKSAAEGKGQKDAPANNAAANPSANAENAPAINILAQYVKDLSFENPSATQPMPEDAQPNIDVQMALANNKIAEEAVEVTLKITAKATRGDKTVFMLEMTYAAICRVRNIPEKDLEPALMIWVPQQFFPFARRIIADITRDGGVPPFLLEPIDFAAIYRQGQAQAKAQAEGKGEALPNV